MVPSAASPWKRDRSRGRPWRRLSSSPTMKPTLWRWNWCSGPGLPRATTRWIASAATPS